MQFAQYPIVFESGCEHMVLSFASSESIQPQSLAFMADLGSVLRQLLQEVQDLRAENQQLIERVEALEDLQELYHGPVPEKDDWPYLKDALARQKDSLSGVSCKIDELGQDCQSLEQRMDAIEDKAKRSYGKKAVHRAKRLKELLKGYGGSQTFKQLQGDLGLDPSQFSQLVNKLDKRIFEVVRRPGGKRGEKVLKLRVRSKGH